MAKLDNAAAATTVDSDRKLAAVVVAMWLFDRGRGLGIGRTKIANFSQLVLKVD